MWRKHHDIHLYPDDSISSQHGSLAFHLGKGLLPAAFYHFFIALYPPSCEILNGRKKIPCDIESLHNIARNNSKIFLNAIMFNVTAGNDQKNTSSENYLLLNIIIFTRRKTPGFIHGECQALFLQIGKRPGGFTRHPALPYPATASPAAREKTGFPRFGELIHNHPIVQ